MAIYSIPLSGMNKCESRWFFGEGGGVGGVGIPNKCYILTLLVYSLFRWKFEE